MEINVIVWMFLIGAAIAMLMMYYNARFLGRLVRALLDIDATSPETALTLEEVNIKMTPALKYSLRPGTSFSETVLKTEDDRYYIAPDKISLAKAKYRGKDTTLLFILLCLGALAVVAFAFAYIFPELLDKVGADFTNIFGNGGPNR